MECPLALAFQIIPGSPAPLYRQLIDQTKRAIAAGQLQPGDALPSVRALAEQLLINPNTVARAYADLIRDGLLESAPGRAVTVAWQRPVFTKTERLRRIQPLLRSYVTEALALGFDPDAVASLVRKELKSIGPVAERPAANPAGGKP